MIATGLPIDAILPDIVSTLETHDTLLLTAEPGAGKSTVVPLALLECGFLAGRKIIMLEPRVLAARAAAKRMAFLLGENPGETVGYRTRLESRCSAQTRIEVVTEAILTKMLQNDPALEDTACVIFDEFHERSIHADLAFTLALDAKRALREDLRIAIMSATLETAALEEHLNHPVVLSAQGRCFPVRVLYSAEHAALPLEERIRNAVRSAAGAFPGDILVFLPGEGEIRRAEALLSKTPGPWKILPLYGSLAAARQDLVFTPHDESVRRIVLATSIAETSLTIPGIRIVIDSGLMRTPRFSPATGMDSLETVPVTKAGAEQRRGRAGRTSPGVCVRLWAEFEQARLADRIPPEILSADLAPAALELLHWGCRPETAGEQLPWLDLPPKPMLEQAFALLEEMGAFDQNGLTAYGRKLNQIPLHPRLAHAVLTGARLGFPARAAGIGALLSERDPMPSGGTASLSLRLDARAGDPAIRNAVERTAAKIRALLPPGQDRKTPPPDALILAAAYPDRIARRKDAASGEYVLSNGVTAFLNPRDALCDAEFLAVAETATLRGRTVIHLAESLDVDELDRTFPGLVRERREVRFDPEKHAAVTEKIRAAGSVVLYRGPCPKAPPEEILPVLWTAVRKAGWDAVFTPSAALESFRGRVNFLHAAGLEDYPDFSVETLMATLEQWLEPYARDCGSFAALAKLDLRSALENFLPGRALRSMRELAPERFETPAGSSVRIDYSNPIQPAASVRLQELFGLKSTPRLAGRIPLLLDILSPAMRTVQKTSDLESFWKESYFLVRKDMRGRYPRHDWPEDPSNAIPHRGVRKPRI